MDSFDHACVSVQKRRETRVIEDTYVGAVVEASEVALRRRGGGGGAGWGGSTAGGAERRARGEPRTLDLVPADLHADDAAGACRNARAGAA